jgi:hypothetical protein
LANGNLINRGVAWDSRALPWEALVEEEMEIIKSINALVKKIKQDNTEKPDDDRKRWDKKHPYYPWANIEKHRCHRIIMLDGMRGAGKTSLMLTLLNGWLSPSEYEKNTNPFAGMDKVIKPLPPLDFDSLPPDLPLYNWIIQCFGPVVDKLTGSKQQDGFLGDYENGNEKSLRQRFRDLQQAAAIGWTAGMLKNQMSSGMDEFLLWQDQQQTDWQKLQNNWQCFLDEMFKQLEKSDLPFDKDALIAVSIDDLDLQPSRLRELLLVLRSLHHDRLVYFLNGHMENLRTVLETEYYLSFIQNGSQFIEELRDKIKEQAETLANALIEKAVPKSHHFSLSGLNLADKKAMKWTPTKSGANTLGQILEKLDSDFAEFINNEERLKLFKDGLKIPFRALQQFFDQYHQSEKSQNGIEGLKEFLEMVFSRSPNEDKIHVDLSEDGETIEISESRPGYFAPAPYDYDSYPLTRNVTLHRLRSVDFANIKSNPDSEKNGRLDTNAADPALLMALELAAHDSKKFKFLNGPRPTSRTFGFVWSQLSTSKGQIIFPWPYSEQLKSPSEWKEKVKEWNEILNDIDNKNPSNNVQENILKAWCCFIMNASPSQLEKKSLADFIGEAKLRGYSDALLPLASKYSGLSLKEREEIAKVLELKDVNVITKSGLDYSYWWETTFPIPMDPYDFAALLLKNTDEQKILEAIKTLLIEDIQLPNPETEAKESEENKPSDNSK